MKKFRVYGTTKVVVTKEVWANTEEEAMGKAYQRLSSLTAYGGNGGWDKLVGVSEYDETVEIDEDIEYDDTEVLEDDPDYFECPECETKCDRMTDADGDEYWYCAECCQAYDDNGDVFYPNIEDDN